MWKLVETLLEFGAPLWAPKARRATLALVGLVGLTSWSAGWFFASLRYGGGNVAAPQRRAAYVNRDGVVTRRVNFDEYGLTVDRKEDVKTLSYVLRFAREPEEFFVVSDIAGTPTKVRVADRTWEVTFYSATGFGNPPMEADFRIEAQ
jgi:hypothetical protein